MSINILLVSTSMSDRQNIRTILNEYNIFTAANEAETMRVLEEHEDICLMLLDMDIPGVNGIGLLESLKASNAYNNLHTIIMSEQEEQENVAEGLQLGIIDYIKKPADMEVLKANIDIKAKIFETQALLQKRYKEAGIIFETIYMQVPVGISVYFEDYPYTGKSGSGHYYYNPEYLRILGRTEEELLELGWEAHTHPDDLEKDLENFEKLKSGEIDSYSMEKRMFRADGSPIWVQILVAVINLPEPCAFSYITILQDIDDQKTISMELIESERSKSVLLSNLNGMAYRCACNSDRTMEFISTGCHALCGCEPERLIGHKGCSFDELIAPEYRERLWQEWEIALRDKTQLQSEYEIIDFNGKRKWVMELGEGVFDEEGEIEALEGIIIDISARKDAENKLLYVSQHHWTGLYNLHHLEKTLEEDLSTEERAHSALISANLNPIYSLTVKYGMQYSQHLTAKIAAALAKLANEQRILFATASHRFVFYLKAYEDKDELVDFCNEISVILKSFLDMERINFGIGVYEIDEATADDVEGIFYAIRLASEEALASEDEKGNIYFYDEELEKRVYRGNLMRHELASVAEGEDQDRILLQYQPIIDLRDKQISGFEALARFDSKGLGRILPLEFIPIAEETKDIIPIGKVIIQKACGFLKRLQANGYDDLNVSINISPIQLISEKFVESVVEILAQMDVNPKSVSFEVTESVFSANFDRINAVIGRLRDHGIKSSIDDFGTAYSSLSRLRELNVHFIKMDRPFISRITKKDQEATITNDIISMAHKMGLFVVAEGVEEAHQLEYLKLYGCDKAQGFLISKPMDEDVAIEFLRRWGK